MNEDLCLPYKYAVGESVIIDGDHSLIAYVVVINWDGMGLEYKLSWMHNGSEHSGWFQPWRLSRTEQ